MNLPMPVDMFPSRFFNELNDIPEFAREGSYDEVIMRAALPPKQAFLPGLFLMFHDCYYKLPSFADFRRFYLRALAKNDKFDEKFKVNFVDIEPAFDQAGNRRLTPKPGLLWRMTGWYEDSMAHAFLYSVVVLAYEELDQSAFVLFDARSDWKFKADLVVVRVEEGEAKAVRVDISGQSEEHRPEVVKQRNQREKETKANNSVSSNLTNTTFEKMPVVQISRNDGEAIRKRNFKFFSVNALEKLLTDIDRKLQHPRSHPMVVPEMLKVKMRELQKLR
jgi:hypothetical protein